MLYKNTLCPAMLRLAGTAGVEFFTGI
jgi:hypothetical protein